MPSAAALAELRLEPVLEAVDDVLAPGPVRGPPPPPASDSILGQVADADGLAGEELEAGEVLEAGGDPRAPLVERKAPKVDAVEHDRAGRRLVEPAQELHERRLAGAVLAHDRDRRTGRQFEIDALEDLSLGAGIREAEVVEPDPVRDRRGELGIGRRRRLTGDELAQPAEVGHRSRSALQLLEQRHRRRHLPVDLGGERDHDDDVTDALLARDHLPHDEQCGDDIRRCEHELAGDPQEPGA